MTVLIVSPLSRVSDVLQLHKPSHMLTLIAPDAAQPQSPLAPSRHRTLRFNDIGAPQAGLVLPDHALITAIFEFAHTWDRAAPLLVHCLAGISRSTAAAYMLACADASPGQEHDIARRLRAAAPTATPNPLMVAIADDLLERDGAMVEAIRAIGRGENAIEGMPFLFPLGMPK